MLQQKNSLQTSPFSPILEAAKSGSCSMPDALTAALCVVMRERRILHGRDDLPVQDLFARASQNDLNEFLRGCGLEERRFALFLYTACCGLDENYGLFDALARLIYVKALETHREILASDYFLLAQAEAQLERDQEQLKRDRTELEARRADTAQHSRRLLHHARQVLGSRLRVCRRSNAALHHQVTRAERHSRRLSAVGRYLQIPRES